MTETINFSYKSIGNFAKLLVTIKFEKENSPREVSVFHQRFDNDESDELFEKFLMELYPEGATIGEHEINQLVKYVSRYMEKDEKTKDLFVEYDKRHYKSYVYFKIDKKITPARLGQHTEIIFDTCIDYFKNFNEIDTDYLKKFIIDNFEIKSDFTTINKVVTDLNLRTIARCILAGGRW